MMLQGSDVLGERSRTFLLYEEPSKNVFPDHVVKSINRGDVMESCKEAHYKLMISAVCGYCKHYSSLKRCPNYKNFLKHNVACPYQELKDLKHFLGGKDV